MAESRSGKEDSGDDTFSADTSREDVPANEQEKSNSDMASRTTRNDVTANGQANNNPDMAKQRESEQGKASKQGKSGRRETDQKNTNRKNSHGQSNQVESQETKGNPGLDDLEQGKRQGPVDTRQAGGEGEGGQMMPRTGHGHAEQGSYTIPETKNQQRSYSDVASANTRQVPHSLEPTPQQATKQVKTRNNVYKLLWFGYLFRAQNLFRAFARNFRVQKSRYKKDRGL